MTEATLMTEAANTTQAPASTTPEEGATVAPAEGQVPAAEGQSSAGDATEKPKDKPEAPPGAPEKYELTLPEGAQMDEAGIASFAELAKDLNLTNDAAQAMLGKLAPAMQARQAQQQQAALAAWTDQSKADKEFGGDKLTENVAIAQKALKQFGTPELTALLNQSGLGSHPEIIRAFYRAGKAISEDGFVNGQSGKASQGDARRLYAASNMNP